MASLVLLLALLLADLVWDFRTSKKLYLSATSSRVEMRR
jgi:hypothetical protein